MSQQKAEHYKRLRGSYRACFCNPDGQLHPAGKDVLANLRALSMYGSSPFSTDALTMAKQVGAQDIFRQILMSLNIPDEAIYGLIGMANQLTEQEDKEFYER